MLRGFGLSTWNGLQAVRGVSPDLPPALRELGLTADGCPAELRFLCLSDLGSPTILPCTATFPQLRTLVLGSTTSHRVLSEFFGCINTPVLQRLALVRVLASSILDDEAIQRAVTQPTLRSFALVGDAARDGPHRRTLENVMATAPSIERLTVDMTNLAWSSAINTHNIKLLRLYRTVKSVEQPVPIPTIVQTLRNFSFPNLKALHLPPLSQYQSNVLKSHKVWSDEVYRVRSEMAMLKEVCITKGIELRFERCSQARDWFHGMLEDVGDGS